MSSLSTHFRILPIGLLAAMLASCSGSETTQQTAAPAAAAAPTSFANITRDRLLNADAEPGEWMTEGRDFGKSHHSPLDQINLDNIDRLGFAWEYKTTTSRGMEANPIVVDGVLFTSGTTGRVYALNAATGEEYWYFDPLSDGQVNRYTCCDEVNRGVAVWDGMVYVGSLDGRLFGLDAATGEVRWEVDTLIYKDRAYTSSGAPEVAGDVVVIGNAGADYDARGYMSAYDLKSGELRWRFFIVPGDPALGFEHPELEMAAETWDPNSRWDVGGGGTAWNAMVYDPELNLIYIGTGNSALFNWHERSPSGGDNLFLCSILAIDPSTGRLVWHYQQVPRESWDFTATQPMILADMEFDGVMRKVLMQAPKAGFFYILDRATGELLSADPYVPVNWAFGVDLATGRPDMNPAVDYDFGGPPIFVEPSGMGGHAWNPMAWNPDNKLVYIPSIEGGAISYDVTDGHVYRPKQGNNGNMILFGESMMMNTDALQEPLRSVLKEVQDAGKAESRAALKAFDPATGSLVWEQENEGWWDRAGILSTAGGLVFQGTDSGYLRAYRQDNGERVLNLFIGSSIIAAPVSYSVDGVQYIAFLTGWGGGGWFAPHPTSAVIKYGNQNRIIALKLDGGAVPIPQEVSAVGPIPQPPVPNTAAAETITQGQTLFARSCAICHANVDYGMTPDLRRMDANTHATFNAIVLQGARRFRGMPQWDDVLNEEQSNAIHAFLIDLSWKAFEAQQNAQAQPLPDIRIMDTQVFSESITSTSDGTLYAGSVKGNVYRAMPGSSEAHPWIRHSEENGILIILGVLADENTNTLWLCSAPNFFGPERSEGVTSLMSFDLTTAAQKGNYPFPEGGTCNDISIAQDGTVLATDTPGGRILALDPGSNALRVFGQSDLLRGIDGIAFSGDWTLYVNNVQTQKLYRVDIENNRMGALTELQVSHELGGPDSMRLIEGNRFLQAESTVGRLSVVTIEGDNATLTIIDDEVESSPGATVVGNTAYVIESNIQYLFNPELRGQEPDAFMLLARPLP